jgi:hypothetical protein
VSRKFIGIVGVDAGLTSGYVQGVVRLRGSIQTMVKRMHLRMATQVAALAVNGGSQELGGALYIFDLIQEFRLELEAKDLGPPVVVIEDFGLRGDKNSTDRALLSSARIASNLEALIWKSAEEGMEWLHMPWFISPSVAKSTVTDDRLKRWGLWERGRPHSRDAWRLFAAYARSRQDGMSIVGNGHKVFRASGQYA